MTVTKCFYSTCYCIDTLVGLRGRWVRQERRLGASLGARQTQLQGRSLMSTPAPPPTPARQLPPAFGPPLRHKLEGRPGSPSRDWPWRCLSTQLGCGGRRRQRGSLGSVSPRQAHPDRPPHPTPSCTQRAGEGKVNQPHPLISLKGWAQGRAHPGHVSLGVPSCPGGLSRSCCQEVHRTTDAPRDRLAQ